MKAFRDRLGYTFKDAALLESALTHPSALSPGLGRPFERLEFLGDRVLGLLIAEWLYTHFPDEPEGDLSKRLARLVCKETLVQIASTLRLKTALKIRHEKSASQKKRLETLLADGCEALIGALYLDGGIEETRLFIHHHWKPYIETSASPRYDSKSSLQEWIQAAGKGHPQYTLLESSGPAHSPLFTVEVCIEGYPPQQGTGSSKQLAEKAAAQNLLEILDISKKGAQTKLLSTEIHDQG